MIVGRKESLEELRVALSQSRRKLFLIEGQEGVGKSAFLQTSRELINTEKLGRTIQLLIPEVRHPDILYYLYADSLRQLFASLSDETGCEAVRSILSEGGHPPQEKFLRSLHYTSARLGRQELLLIFIDTPARELHLGFSELIDHIPQNVRFIFALEKCDEELHEKAEVLSLEPFSPKDVDEVVELFCSELDEETRRKIANYSEGLPLYVDTATRFMRAGGELENLPRELGELYRMIFSGFKSEQADLLDALCFSPLGAELEAIKSVTEIEESYIRKALTNGQLSRVIVQVPGSNDRYAVFHPGFARAVIDSLTRTRRSAFSTLFAQFYADRLLAGFEKNGVDFEALALHSIYLSHIADPSGYSRQFAFTHHIRYELGLFRELAEDYPKLLELAESDVVKIIKPGTCLSNLGMVYTELGEFSRAEECLQEALEFARRSKSKADEATQLAQLGELAERQGDLTSALEYFTEALKLDTEVGNQPAIASDLNHLGNICSRLGKHKQALAFFNRALKLHSQTGNLEGVANQHAGLGELYRSMGNYEKALAHFTDAMKIDSQLRRFSAQSSDLANMADCLVRMGRAPDGVKPLADAAHSASLAGDLETQCACLQKLAELHLSLGLGQPASITIKKALDLLSAASDPASILRLSQQFAELASRLDDTSLSKEALRLAISAGEELERSDEVAQLKELRSQLLSPSEQEAQEAPSPAPETTSSSTIQIVERENEPPSAPPQDAILQKIADLSERFQRILSDLEQCRQELKELRNYFLEEENGRKS